MNHNKILVIIDICCVSCKVIVNIERKNNQTYKVPLTAKTPKIKNIPTIIITTVANIFNIISPFAFNANSTD